MFIFYFTLCLILCLLTSVSHYVVDNFLIFPAIFILSVIVVRYERQLEKQKEESLENKYNKFLEKFLFNVFDLHLNECLITEHTTLNNFIPHVFNGSYSVVLKNSIEESAAEKIVLERIKALYKINLTTTNIKFSEIFKLVQNNKEISILIEGKKNEKR